jgi:hypothetical protein
MATPAAILSILVKAEGVAGVSRSLTSVNEKLVATDAQGARAEKRLMGVSRAGRTAGTGLAAAAKQAGAFVAAYAGFRGIEKSVETTEELGKAALTLNKSFGLATDSASEWAAVAKARGTDGQKLTMGFKQLSTQVRQAAGGSKEAVKSFKELGVSQSDLKKHGGDLEYVLKRVSDGLGEMPAGTEKAAVQAKLFGRTWLALSPLIRDGSDAMNKQLSVADEYGAKLGGKGVKAVEDSIKAHREAKLAVMGLQVAIGTTLIPIIDQAIEGFAHWVKAFRDGTGSAGAFRGAIEKVLGVLSPFGESVKQIVGFLKEHKAVAQPLIGILISLAAAQTLWNLAAAASPITLLIVGLAALTVGLVTAYRESETFRGIIDAVFGALKSAFETVQQVVQSSTFQDVLTTALGLITAAFGGMVTAAQAAFGWLKGAFTAVVGAIGTATSAIIGEISQWDTLWSAIGRGAQIMVAVVKVAFDALKVAFQAGLLVLAPIAVAAWTLIEGIFSAAWAAIKGIVEGGLKVIRGVILIIGGLFKGDFGQIWDGIKTVFSGGIRALKGILEGAWKILKAPVEALGAGLHDAFANSWDRIKDLFRTSINAVIDFLNVLIKAINAIPGVPDIGTIGKLGGGQGGGGGGGGQKNLGQTGHLARGGAYGRTGGMVRTPTVLMGEDAPRHPEYVIPTNPMYRDRAVGLLGQAAQAVGLQAGGKWGIGALEKLWTGEGGAGRLAHTMAVISTAESGVAGQYGNQYARNPSGATGLWQILGALVPGNLMNAHVNARNAVAKYAAQGLGAWTASRSIWEPLLHGALPTGGGGGLSADDILGQFPKVTAAMGMFKDLGKYVLGKAGGYVKDKVSNLFTGKAQPGGMGLGGPIAQGLVPQVVAAVQWARGHGWAGQVTSGFRSRAEQARLYARYLAGGPLAAKPGTSSHETGQAVDVSDYAAFGRAMLSAPPAARLYNRLGAADPVHYSVSGYAKGGMLPWLGSFQRGGITGQEGVAHLHANEAVLPMKKGGLPPTKHARRVTIPTTKKMPKFPGFKTPRDARGRLLRPGQLPRKFGDPVAVVPTDSGDGGQVDQALLDAIAAQTAATEENTRIQNAVRDQQDIITSNQTKILAMAGQGDAILASVVAAVNGGIGGRAGLGFQSPSYAGGIARYK